MAVFNPYFALAGAIALVAAAGGGFIKGQDYARAKGDQAKLQQLVKALDERDAKQVKIDQLVKAAAQQEQARQVEVRNVYTEIPRIIDRPIYRNVCVDGDGVRLLDRARAAASGDAGLDPRAPAGQAGGGAGSPAQR